MIGSFLTRGLVMIFGYAYPAYECYKSVEQNKPEIEQLRFWCQYWILVALLTVCERIGDAFVSWVPMYSEAKLAFYIYLWYPKTRGTTYVYNSFFRPYVAKHENEIDRNLLELRTRAGDITFSYWQRAASHVQTRVFEILQYVAAQSTQAPQAAQGHVGKPLQPSQGAEQRPATGTRRQPPDSGESASFVSSSTSSSWHQNEIAEEVGPSQVSKVASSRASSSAPNANATSENSSEEINFVAEPKQSEPVPPPGETAEPPPKETVIEETVRLTRARLRSARTSADS